MLTVTEAHDPQAWNSFLARQQFRPFLQSWEMGEVYREIGQEPVRLEVREGNEIVGICFGHIVPARRGKHLSIPYGPVLGTGDWGLGTRNILDKLTHIARETGCSFIRLSPFLPLCHGSTELTMTQQGFRPSPLHLLAEHLWYLPLTEPDPWEMPPPPSPLPRRPGEGEFPSPPQGGGVRGGGNAEQIFKNMRATHRNLIRRAEKEGVTITTSDNPIRDLPLFLALHDETHKRHSFTPYTDAFFQAQIKHFSTHPVATIPESSLRESNQRNNEQRATPSCSLYLAHYKNEVIAASIHMHFAGETSYHHGASTQKYRNIPASYLLQWQAIQDAVARGDHVYNFWGVAPSQNDEKQKSEEQGNFLKEKQPQERASIPLSPFKKFPCSSRHPFAGVTLFKTGFGGKLLELQHCIDLPLKPTYYLTRAFETLRKWHRGF